MSEAFLSDDNLSVSAARPFGGCANEEDRPNDGCAVSEQEIIVQITVTVVGCHKAVLETIHTLDLLQKSSSHRATADLGQINTD
ncbi:MAG: hypothetical protein ABI180_11690 [Microcoleus sp.]